MARSLRIALVLAGAGLAALLASGCAGVRPGSLRVAEAGSGRSAHVHLELCTPGQEPEGDGFEYCARVSSDAKDHVNEETAEFKEFEDQSMLAFAVPVGTSAPQTISAVGGELSPSFTYTRNAEASAAFVKAERKEGDSRPWPPPGTEIVAFLGPWMPEHLEEWKWSLDADFVLPVPADGGVYGGPFSLEVAQGVRFAGVGKIGGMVFAEAPRGRPIECNEEGSAPTSSCEVVEAASAPITELKLAPAPAVTAFPGAHATLSFPAAYASSAVPPAPYALTAATAVPKGAATPAPPTFSAAVDPGTHRAAPTAASVAVAVPKGVKSGSYPVTLTATGPSGAISQAGTLTIKSAKPKFGKVKPDRAKGTALVAVKLPGAGTLTVSGKGLAKVTKKATRAKTLTVGLKATGSTAAALATVGRATLKAKFKFKPSNGAAVTVPRAVVFALGR